MKKIMIPLMLVLIFSLSGCGAAGEAPPAAEVPVPSMEELAGRYGDGAITFEKVHISDAIIAKAQKKVDDAEANADEDDPFDQIDVAGAGCDLAILETLMSYEGQTVPNPFLISMVDETEGTLQFEGEEDADDEEDMTITDVITFSYSPDSGALTFTKGLEGMKIANSLYASYEEENKAGISGALRLTVTGESDFYIDLTVTGTKSLNGQ